MSALSQSRWVRGALRTAPVLFLVAVLLVFGSLSSHFLSPTNLSAILLQSSWLAVAALGVNFVLLTSGVDLSVGAGMYLAAVIVALGLRTAPSWLAVLAAVAVGSALGTLNGLLVARFRLPPFITTLATAFLGRAVALSLSSTQIVFASPSVAALGRNALFGIPATLWMALLAIALAWGLLHATACGPYVRCVGADTEGARRLGLPIRGLRVSVYALCGAYAGLAGFISLSQTSSASSAFGQNSEFLAIAAAVLGGTSLYGGRGTLWGPLVGAVLITTVQNGLALINANPYAYPVVAGVVIL